MFFKKSLLSYKQLSGLPMSEVEEYIRSLKSPARLIALRKKIPKGSSFLRVVDSILFRHVYVGNDVSGPDKIGKLYFDTDEESNTVCVVDGNNFSSLNLYGEHVKKVTFTEDAKDLSYGLDPFPFLDCVEILSCPVRVRKLSSKSAKRLVIKDVSTDLKRRALQGFPNITELVLGVCTKDVDGYLFCCVPYLETLILEDCFIQNLLHFDYEFFPSLRSLTIQRTSLMSIGHTCLFLPSLETLELRDNICLNRVSSFDNLKRLRRLVISGNYLNSQIYKIGNLKNLEHLEVSNERLLSIPRVISKLVQLKSLDLSNNQISEIDRLSSLASLERLNLRNNEITDVSTVSKLTSLVVLDLSSNRIEQAPSFQNLTKLRKLSMKKCGLNDVKQFDCLKSLEFLDVAGNPLFTRLEADKLPNLRVLVINYFPKQLVEGKKIFLR